jgi:AAA+ ATPase superfamily predicted ATPase
MNPFKYGGIVSGRDFADRKMELPEMIKEVTSGQSMLLYSPRRYGKSSLAVAVLDQLQKNNFMTAFIDLYGCVSEADLANKLIEKTVIPAYDTMDKVLNFFKSSFSGVRPELKISSDGKVTVSFTREPQALGEKELSEVLDVPEKLAKAKGKRLVVVFDEFQEIISLDGVRLEKLMRASFQHHKLVTYIFMGSKRHIIEQMFENVNGPFYRFAKPFPIQKIPVVEFKSFILSRFNETKIRIAPSIVDSILLFTDGHPYFTQQLCHELWNIACEKDVVGELDMKQAVENILSLHNDLFLRLWDSMTLPQRRVLIALSLENKTTLIYSLAWIKKYGLQSPSHVKRAINQLVKIGAVEKSEGSYYLQDIFFREWIKAKIERS